MSTLLKLEGVHTRVGPYHLLHGIDLEVRQGEVTMLLGRNGAGKTTTLRTIMGLWRASEGGIRLRGESIERLPTSDIAKRGISYVPENMGIFTTLSVKDNLLLAARNAARVEAFDADRVERIFSFFPALQKFWLYPAGKLSGGQRQMLAVARAMIEPRELLLIDEPSKGLAPAIVQNLISAFLELKRERTTLLLVEQNFSLAKAVGDRVAVVDNGRVVHAGTMAALAEDDDLQHHLLGLSLGAHQ